MRAQRAACVEKESTAKLNEFSLEMTGEYTT